MQASQDYVGTDVPATATVSGGHRHLLFHAAWGLGAIVFVSIGWLAMRPWDPRGAISLLTHVNPSMMMLEVLALAVATSAVATVLAGQDHPDVGVFAVGIGLTLASFKGGNMTKLLLETDGDPGLCWWLAAEGLFWFGAIVLSMFTAAIVTRWCGGQRLGGGDRSKASTPLATMSAPAIPFVGPLLFGRTERPSSWRMGVKHMAVVALLGLVLVRVLGVGATDRTIHHGQACFSVALGVYLAARRAYVYFPVRSALWSCCAVPLVCVFGFAFAWLMSSGSEPGTTLASIPASTFLRSLPITYIAAGTCAAMIAHWRSTEPYPASA